MQKKNDEMDDKELKAIINQLKEDIEILELMNGDTPLRIILFLLIFSEVSLTKMSSLVGKVKSTITHHLKKLDKNKLLEVTEKDARGSIDSKIFSLKKNFLQNTALDPNRLKNLKEEDLKQIIQYLMVKNSLFLKTMSQIFERASKFYQDFNALTSTIEKGSFDDYLKLFFYNLFEYELCFLDEKSYKEYEEITKQFKEQLREIIKKNHEESDVIEKPYLLFHSLFPIEKLTKYDAESKKMLKFFDSLPH